MDSRQGSELKDAVQKHTVAEVGHNLRAASGEQKGNAGTDGDALDPSIDRGR
jgi:hypothetical protein